MCAKIRDNKRQNNNFIHIAIKKRTAIHPATMFRIASASGLKQIITLTSIPATNVSTVSTANQIMFAAAPAAVWCTKTNSTSIKSCPPINRLICVQ